MIRTREPGRKEQVEGPMIFGLPAAARQQTLVALQAQSILLSDAETLMVNWLRRRRDAASDAQRHRDLLESLSTVTAAGTNSRWSSERRAVDAT
jgi:hypothetical protein